MLRPLRDVVFVSIIKGDEKVAGGLLYKPLTVEDGVVEGKVVAVGSGLITDSGHIVPLEVKEGDRVLFHKASAMEVKHNGETLYRLREEQILTGLQ